MKRVLNISNRIVELNDYIVLLPNEEKSFLDYELNEFLLQKINTFENLGIVRSYDAPDPDNAEEEVINTGMVEASRVEVTECDHDHEEEPEVKEEIIEEVKEEEKPEEVKEEAKEEKAKEDKSEEEKKPVKRTRKKTSKK